MKIRHYVTRRAWAGSTATWGYWVPTKKMKAVGFKNIACGEDGPQAWAIAESWNKRWDEAKQQLRAGLPVDPRKIERVYPPGSIGEAYQRYKTMETYKDKAERTQEDWERGWAMIEPIFGDVDPRTVALEHCDAWYAGLLARVGVREAHRGMKIWRALWKKIGTMNAPDGKRYCSADADPSLGIRRKTPTARNAFWYEGEAVRLIKRAWRMGKYGAAAALAVIWDSSLSPGDGVALTPAQLRGDAEGPFFQTDRTKTGKAAIATLSRRTVRLIEAYKEQLGFDLHDNVPMFRTAGATPGPKGGRRWLPQPYTVNKLGKDFRDVRVAEFPGDKRTIADFRRSGSIEATAGEVAPAALAGKLANSIDSNKMLQETYTPHTATLVRLADAARVRGRSRMRGKSTS